VSAPPAIDQECVEGYLFVRAPLRILLLRRPPARGSIWAPVSGKVDAADASLESALRRELREETGFDAPEALLDLDWRVPFVGPDGRRWRLHAYGVELERPGAPVLSVEHVEFAWLPWDRARSRLHYEDNREAVDRLVARVASPHGSGQSS